MNHEPIFSEFSEGFAETLLDYCAAPGPEPAFLNGLEQKLLGRQAVLLRSEHTERTNPRRWWKQFRGSVTRHAWQYTVIGVLIVLSAAVIAIGPQRVLAQVRQWLGYLPGVGFVNPDQVRVLAAPVEARQGNTILEVQQVIASADQTVLVATLDGPAEEIPLGMEWATQVTMILPDGQRLTPRNSTQNTQAGQLRAEIVYVRFPLGVSQVTLEMPTLPIGKDGTQEFWSVVLPLTEVRQMTTDAYGGASAGSLAVAPYTPKIAQAANQGVTVHLLQVAQSEQETGLLLQFDWSDPTWDYNGASVELRDNLGRVYQRLEPPPGTGAHALRFARHQNPAQQMMRFAPLEPGARQLTLTLKAINFEAHPAVQFVFDPGEHPTLGQTWWFGDDLAMRLAITGIQLQVLTARLSTPPAGAKLQVPERPAGTLIPQPTDVPEPACRLEFLLETTPQAQAQIIFVSTSMVGKFPRSYGLGSVSEDNGRRFTQYMDLAEIPTAPLTIEWDDVTFFLQGGWQFQWDLP